MYFSLLNLDILYYRDECSSRGIVCFIYVTCCIFRPAFGVRSTPNAGKNLKKARNLKQNFAKKHVFLSLHQNAGRLHYIRHYQFCCKYSIHYKSDYFDLRDIIKYQIISYHLQVHPCIVDYFFNVKFTFTLKKISFKSKSKSYFKFFLHV